MSASIVDFITRDETARRLGVKPRSIAEFVSQSKLTPVKYQRPGKSGGAVNLFDPDEVQALADQRAAARQETLATPSVVVAGLPAPAHFAQLSRTYSVAQPQPAPPTERDRLDSIATETKRLAAAFESGPPPSLPFQEKRYLSLEESAAYTGLSVAYIKRTARGVPAGPHGSLVYRRDVLNKL